MREEVIYVAEDGKRFDSEKECVDYEVKKAILGSEPIEVRVEIWQSETESEGWKKKWIEVSGYEGFRELVRNSDRIDMIKGNAKSVRRIIEELNAETGFCYLDDFLELVRNVEGLVAAYYDTGREEWLSVVEVREEISKWREIMREMIGGMEDTKEWKEGVEEMCRKLVDGLCM